jgi:hypothetical protein
MSPITLLYRGRLLGQNDKDNKHEIRKYFRSQLHSLWDDPPTDLYSCRVGGDVFPSIKGISFQPTIYQRCATCELDIMILSRSKPGSLIHDGDLDNRLKNLFDALRLPKLNELPDNLEEDQNTTFEVLLEDDRSITDFRVRSATLLIPKRPDEPLCYAEITIEVKIRTPNQI